MAILDSEKPTISNPSTPCHNCRRKRWRCDRSLPGCHKCSSRSEECLGYGLLLRWTNAVAVRGKLRGQAFHQEPHNQCKQTQDSFGPKKHLGGETSIITETWPVRLNLVDPLLQDLGHRHRLYINHFTTTVCQDLVSFDQVDHSNPFRSTITLLGEYDFLREIILATSAVHIATLRRSRGQPARRELADALVARGRAYRLLRQALANLGVASQRAVVMIAIVFFINFDLIDSGQGSWMPHIKAAGNLIASIQTINGYIPPFITQLADLVVADCLTYHILGSALMGAQNTAMDAFGAIDIAATLQKAAVYSYHCCPPFVLDVLARACKLSVNDVPEARSLVEQLRNFDVGTWVHKLEGLPATDDPGARVSVASAHRAATCLYVVLVVPDVSMYLVEHLGPAFLIQEIFDHLSLVPIEHALAKGVVWPTFLAGAQTDDSARRRWCLQRLQRMWFSTPWICPWGYIESAIVMLQSVWKARDQKVRNKKSNGLNWLQELRGSEGHCLIV